jgi:GT2 family glycosyltransferase
MTRASIVIPVHSQVGLTARCLEILLRQPLGVEAEIIVVDDASTDETPGLLSQLVADGAALRVVTHSVNTGFAGACNDGAAVATGDHLVFLNNDTEPRPGWLEALVGYADAHPSAASVGAKLLFPDGTVQHAGVVIGQDRNPHHVYAGFPGDHRAVNRSRAFQVVTAACMLVRRDRFEEMGGFDIAYRNGHEDVDLCLRLGAAGYEIHYCHESVVVHLESASRGRRSVESAANGRRYREQWAARVQPDDLGVYIDDGLLGLGYNDTYPLRLQVSPMLATVHDSVRNRATERLLRARAQQVADLLQRLIALTTGAVETLAPVDDPDLDDDIVEALDQLDQALASRTGRRPDAGRTSDLAYRRRVARIRRTIVTLTAPGAVVAVVSRGDDELVDIDDRTGWHFPEDDDGRWAGHHPADSDAAVEAMASAIRRGATHLVIPTCSLWWLDHYQGFAAYLSSIHVRQHTDDDCIVFALVGKLQEVLT